MKEIQSGSANFVFFQSPLVVLFLIYFVTLSTFNWVITPSNILTLPETNIAHENPIFPGKYHQNGGFSMAMLVSGSV